MNPNGTRFHLLKESSDWLECREEGLAGKLRETNGGTETKLFYGDALTLKKQLPLFRHRAAKQPLSPGLRRGSAVDRYGNFFWIAADRRRIFWLPSGSGRPVVFWEERMTPPACSAGAFHKAAPETPETLILAGLAVTGRHYLVAGQAGGLLVFDLHKGGEPMQLGFPDNLDLHPADLAASLGGGVWILDDGKPARYWQLDRNFCLAVESAEAPLAGHAGPGAFTPEDGAPVIPPVTRRIPEGVPIAAQNPIAIEALPDGGVLILDAPPAPSPSTLLHYDGGNLVQSFPLQISVDAEQLDDGIDIKELTITAHDFAFNPCNDTLYVVDVLGKQALAFKMPKGSPPILQANIDYLPLHAFGGRGLVLRRQADASPYVCTIFYDLDAGAGRDDTVRWAQLQALEEESRYQRQGSIITPVFDGKERDCLWDGLFLDACIPPGAEVHISTRAHNEKDLVQTAPFLREPPLYLRRLGCEISYYDPFEEVNPRPDFAGTWELLLQRAVGRYFQVRIELQGNASVTPRLHALRVYYPRFSYVQNYLPAVYREEPESASFLERFLANPQGFYTYIEGHISAVDLLFDPRSAPAEALDWLAGWVGLALDPLWPELHKRQTDVSITARHTWSDRRRLFIRFAHRLFERRGTPEGILLALNLLLNPCLEAMLERLKTGAVSRDAGLQQELERLGLPYPTPELLDQDIEDLLYAYLLAPNRLAKIRIVERFMTRGGRAAVAGDLSTAGSGVPEDTLANTAHRFSVLLPEGLAEETISMVRRIVDLEKPGHTDYDLRGYWENYRIGEVRLGLDTVLGDSGQFVPIILGYQGLAEGYLESAPPMDAAGRVILDRDHLGEAPPL